MCTAWRGPDAAYDHRLRADAARSATRLGRGAGGRCPTFCTACRFLDMIAGIVAGVGPLLGGKVVADNFAFWPVVDFGWSWPDHRRRTYRLGGRRSPASWSVCTTPPTRKQRRSCERVRIGRLIESNYETPPAAIRLRVPIRQYQGSAHEHGVTTRIEQEEMSQTARRNTRGASSPLRIVADASLSRNPKCCVSV